MSNVVALQNRVKSYRKRGTICSVLFVKSQNHRPFGVETIKHMMKGENNELNRTAWEKKLKRAYPNCDFAITEVKEFRG